MKNYTLITSVYVDLRGQTPFPVTFFDGDPAIIEAEVQQLAQNILKPGYPTKSDREDRLPLIGFLETRNGEIAPDGNISISEEESFCRRPILDVPAECQLNIFNGKSGIVFEFKNNQRKLLRRACMSREELAVAVSKYRAMVRQCEVIVRDAAKELQRYIPDFDIRKTKIILDRLDRKEIIGAKLRLVHADRFRRDTHNDGSHFVDTAMAMRGVMLKNPTSPQDITMRVFELVSFLMSDPQEAINYQPVEPLSFRHPGKFRCVIACSP